MDKIYLENAWQRGWKDTKAAWTSWQFLLFEAIGGGVMAIIAQWWGLVFVIAGLVGVWFGATVNSPIKQRNEARKYACELENNIKIKNYKENVAFHLAMSVMEGGNLLNSFQTLKRDKNNDKAYWPIEPFNQWTSDGLGILSNNHLIQDTLLWIKDIDLYPKDAIIDDYIRALTNGIARFESIIAKLGDTDM